MLNRFIVCFTIALAILPVAADYFGPSWRARWLLADAANQYDRGNVEQARELLRESVRLSEDIALDQNFWLQLARIELSDRPTPSSINEWIATIEQIEPESVRRTVALRAASSILEKGKEPIAIAILEKFLPPISERTLEENNQIAYYRALDRSDLDIALEEVNASLAKSQNELNLDTKAWVLHEYDRDPEALAFANRSIERALDSLKTNFPNIFEVAHTQFKSRLAEKKTSIEGSVLDEFTEAEIDSVLEFDNLHNSRSIFETGELLRKFESKGIGTVGVNRLNQLAILRYHRLSILRSLRDNATPESPGPKKDEGIVDELWLKAFGYVDPTELR